MQSLGRFVEIGDHLFGYAKVLRLQHDTSLEIHKLATFLARLPRLRCLRLHPSSLSHQLREGTSLDLPRLNLQKLELSVRYAMDERAVYALFRLFETVDHLDLNHRILDISHSELTAPSHEIETQQTRVRRLTVKHGYGTSNSGGLQYASRVELLRRVIHPQHLQELIDPKNVCPGRSR